MKKTQHNAQELRRALAAMQSFHYDDLGIQTARTIATAPAPVPIAITVGRNIILPPAQINQVNPIINNQQATTVEYTHNPYEISASPSTPRNQQIIYSATVTKTPERKIFTERLREKGITSINSNLTVTVGPNNINRPAVKPSVVATLKQHAERFEEYARQQGKAGKKDYINNQQAITVGYIHNPYEISASPSTPRNQQIIYSATVTKTPERKSFTERLREKGITSINSNLTVTVGPNNINRPAINLPVNPSLAEILNKNAERFKRHTRQQGKARKKH